MDRIARAVEPSMGYRHQMPEAGEETTVGRAMSNAACDLAETLGASAILVPTFTGRTASAVARLRPRRPIVGLSHHQTAVQQMALEWGVTPVLMPQTDDVEDLWSRSLESALKSGVVDAGDRVVTDGRHGGQPARLDERDQGRHRLGNASVAGDLSRRARDCGAPRETVAVLRLRPTRLLALGGLVLVALPLLEAAAHLRAHEAASCSRATAEVQCAPAEKTQLAEAHRRWPARGEQLVREARRLGLVKPGEQLFIVRGIDAWRTAHH